MLLKGIYEMAAFAHHRSQVGELCATRLNAKGIGMRTMQKLMGHKHIGTTALMCQTTCVMRWN
jgi:site-specific recombinase XerD